MIFDLGHWALRCLLITECVKNRFNDKNFGLKSKNNRETEIRERERLPEVSNAAECFGPLGLRHHTMRPLKRSRRRIVGLLTAHLCRSTNYDADEEDSVDEMESRR